MEKFDWKSHAKESFKNCLKDLVSMFYITLSIVFILFTQTQKQIEYIAEIIEDRDWTMIFIMIVGVLFLAVIIEKIIKSTWSIIKFVFRAIKSL